MMKDIYTLVLLGESRVGKTCILEKFINSKFDSYEASSQTVKFFRKTLEFPEGKLLTFDILDTPGQEKHRSMNKIFYKQANVVILVYDVTNEDSFTEMKDYWYEKINELENKEIIIAIVANKSDLYEEKQVANETGEEFANQIGAIFVPTSAQNGESIKDLFYKIGQKIIELEDTSLINENKKLKSIINSYKIENERLKETIDKFTNYMLENEEVKIAIEKLKEENNKLNNHLLRANKIIENFNNNQHDEQEKNKIICKLNRDLLAKEDMINNLKNQIKYSSNNNINLFNYDDVIFVHFISTDLKIIK